MQARYLIQGALIGCTLAVAMSGPSVAMTFSLTYDEKHGIYNRCMDAGGTFKICCAAADGTVTTDPKSGATYCKLTLTAPTGGGPRHGLFDQTDVFGKSNEQGSELTEKSPG